MKSLGAHPARPQICAISALAVGCLTAMDVPDPAKYLALMLSLALLIIGGPLSAFIAAIVCLPLWMETLTFGSSTWGPLELSLLACAIVAGLHAMLLVVRTRGVQSVSVFLADKSIAIAAIALFVFGTASLFWVADPDLRSDSLRAFRRVIVEPMFIIPVAVFAVRRGLDRSVAFWIAIPAILVSLLAMGQMLFGGSTVDLGGVSRPIGTFTHPNNLAFYLERSIWFVPVATVALTRDRRVLAGVTTVVVLAAILTLSRGSALAILLGFTVFGWTFARSRRRELGAAAVGVAGIVFAFRYFAESGNSVGSRVDIWRSSVEMLRDHPFTGVGLDQFLGQYGTRYVLQSGWAERYTSHPHNLVLDFWLSLGVGGLIVLWMFGEAVWTRLRLSLSEPDWTLQRAALAALVAGIAHGLVDNSFFLPDLATWTWLMLVLAGPSLLRAEDD